MLIIKVRIMINWLNLNLKFCFIRIFLKKLCALHSVAYEGT